MICGNKDDAFRTKVAGSTCFGITAEVAIVDVTQQIGVRRICDVIEVNATLTFSTNKSDGTAIDFTDGNSFRLDTLVIRTALKRVILIIVGVEIERIIPGNDTLQLTAGIVDENSAVAHIPDRERTGTVNVKFIEVTVTINITIDGGGSEATQL